MAGASVATRHPPAMARSTTIPRVLHIATRFAAGGSEQRIRDMIDALPTVQHRLLVGELEAGEHVRCPVAPDEVEVEPALRRSIDLRHDIGALTRLVRRIRVGNYALVVTHQSKAGALGRIAARVAKVPAVHSLSMASFGSGYGRLHSAAFRTVERLLVPLTAGYAIVGHDLARQYQDIGIPPSSLHVIRSGARLPAGADHAEARRQLARVHGFDERRAVIAYVGSLEPRKNPMLLPGYLARVRADAASRDALLLVAGDGPLRGALHAALAAQGLAEHARLLGHIPDPALVFGGADIVVLLSQVEGLPQVLVQAAAAGTPFVAFKVSGVGELLDGGAKGAAVPPGDVEAAAEATVRQLGTITRTAPIDLAEWCPEVIRARYAALLEPILARSAGHGG